MRFDSPKNVLTLAVCGVALLQSTCGSPPVPQTPAVCPSNAAPQPSAAVVTAELVASGGPELALTIPPEEAARAIYKAALEAPEDDEKFWKLVDYLPKDGPNVVMEGDVLLSTDELRRYLVARKESLGLPGDGHGAGTGSSSLIINFWSGKPFYLKDPRTRRLTYTVSRKSFGQDDRSSRDERYNAVVANFAAACREWEALCPRCQISFTHKPSLDDLDVRPGKDVSFVVQERHGNYVAVAFFPFDPADTHYLSVDPSYFGTPADRVGIFRHEIGHILGYRHEHLRAESGCRQDTEIGHWIPITPYDSSSVMHYYCGENSSLEFQFSELDRKAHSALYERGQWQQFAAGTQ